MPTIEVRGIRAVFLPVPFASEKGTVAPEKGQLRLTSSVYDEQDSNLHKR